MAKVAIPFPNMTSLIKSLSGYKTYILAIAGIVVVVLWSQGVIDQETATQLLTALGFGSAMSLRAGMKTEVEKIAE